METINEHMPGYAISTDRNRLDIAMIHHYLSVDSYWAQGIPLKTVERSIRHSLCFGLYAGEHQVGLARVVSDCATFAYLCDVFILPAHRGKGLSKWMMATIHDHPDLQGLRRWMLGTRDAHGLYRQFGWTAIPDDAFPRFMQLHRPDIYTTSL